jgi:hypothetical protein
MKEKYIENQLSFGLCPSSWIKYKNILKYKTTTFRKKSHLPKHRGFIFLYFIQDDGQSPKDNWFSMLYTVVRTL